MEERSEDIVLLVVGDDGVAIHGRKNESAHG